jgi:signal transduction histidine kinase/PAS domain-containing protein
MDQIVAFDVALATMRRALRDEPLEHGLSIAGQALTDALAPAVTHIWLADQAPWIGDGRPGGQELFPLLRLRSTARSGATADRVPFGPPASLSEPASGARLPALVGASPAPSADGLVEEVAASRRAFIAHDPAAAPLAHAWMRAADLEARTPSTLAAFPLLVRDQLLGVLVCGTTRALNPHQLSMLEVVADQCAVAAEHDRLLSYSHGQEALAQTVVRQAPVAVAVLTGHQHVFALANPAFAEMLGVEGRLRGRRLDDVVPEARHLREQLRLDAVYANGEPQAMIELPIQLDRGLTYWNVTSSALPGRTARVGGVLVAAVDMTHQVRERRRAVEAAATAQVRLKQMMALHATSLAVASQLGADPRELLADILRRSMALLEARAGTIYVVDQRVDHLEAIVCEGLRGNYVGSRIRLGQGLAGQVARTGQGLVVDDIRLYPTSSVMYTNEAVSAIIAVPLIHRGRVVGVLDVLDDADNRVFTRNDLWLLELFAAQAAQAIENARTYVELERAYAAQRELDRMKDDFIATASHELRTPLTGIQGFLDLLVDYPGSRDEPLATEFLTRAVDSAGELAQLATRLLQTARLDTGAVDARLEPISVRAMLDHVLRSNDLGTEASARLQHGCDIAVSATLRVLADADRLREVLENLISNAVKYSPDGGTLRVGATVASGADLLRELAETTRTRFAEPDEAQRYAIVTVADQGLGIPPAERDQLFGRFARLEAARTSQIRGSGLGLYICQQLMRGMGGYIWLRASHPGAGSTFAIALPLAADSPAQ